jgi:hypothetical protein
MRGRLKKLGYLLVAAGLVFAVAGAVAYTKTQAGYRALESFSEAQNVTLNYNDAGQLVDRGTVEGAQAIMSLLTDDWGYPVVQSDFDPNDPLVNTATEYMYQMATIGYHTLHGTQTVTLAEDAEYNGEVIPAGTYEFDVDGRYWTDFDRSNPIESVAREQAWSGTVHGLFAELGVGTVTHSALQLGLALAGLFAAVGILSILTGFGMVWVSRGNGVKAPRFVDGEEVDMPKPVDVLASS